MWSAGLWGKDRPTMSDPVAMAVNSSSCKDRDGGTGHWSQGYRKMEGPCRNGVLTGWCASHFVMPWA